MRRLILEFQKQEIEKLHGQIPMHSIKTFEIIQMLRHDEEEFAAICRIEPIDEKVVFANLASDEGFDGNFSGVQVLEKEKSGSYIIFVRHRPVPVEVSSELFKGEGGYILSTEICEDTVKMTYLGTANQVQSILGKIHEHGVRFKILSLTDARFSINSPLNRLTEKQRKVLTAAFKLGYYSLPRRISTEQLAEKLGLHKSALQAHRRKAELRLIAEVLKEQN